MPQDFLVDLEVSEQLDKQALEVHKVLLVYQACRAFKVVQVPRVLQVHLAPLEPRGLGDRLEELGFRVVLAELVQLDYREGREGWGTQGERDLWEPLDFQVKMVL